MAFFLPSCIVASSSNQFFIPPLFPSLLSFPFSPLLPPPSLSHWPFHWGLLWKSQPYCTHRHAHTPIEMCRPHSSALPFFTCIPSFSSSMLLLLFSIYVSSSIFINKIVLGFRFEVSWIQLYAHLISSYKLWISGRMWEMSWGPRWQRLLRWSIDFKWPLHIGCHHRQAHEFSCIWPILGAPRYDLALMIPIQVASFYFTMQSSVVYI